MVKSSHLFVVLAVQQGAPLERVLDLVLIQRPFPEGLSGHTVVPVGDPVVRVELLKGG